MIRRFLAAIAVCAPGLAGATIQAAADEVLTDDERFTVLTEWVEGMAPQAFSELQRLRFAELWSDDDYGDALSEVDDAVVSMRLRAADSILRGIEGVPEWVVERYTASLAAASERGLARDGHYRRLFNFHLLRLEFERAGQVKEWFPHAELPAIPELAALDAEPEPGERLTWSVSDNAVRAQTVAMPAGNASFVVEASPNCGFVRRAAEALGRDELLAPLVAEHGLWLANPRQAGSLQTLAAWNAEFPGAPIHFVAHSEDWPELDFDATPRIVFFSESGAEFDILGWPGGSEGLMEFAEGLVRIGLLDPETLTEDRFAYADQPAARDACAARAPALRTIFDQAPVASLEQLELHLQEAVRTGESPLFLLSEPARERLIDSLFFRDGVSPSFRIDDILELSPEDRYAVASLFGNQHFFAGTFFPPELLSADERDLADRVNCAGEFAEPSSP